MGSGLFDGTERHEHEQSKSKKLAPESSRHWTPVKLERQWVQYVSNDQDERMGAPYDSLSTLGMLDPLEAIEFPAMGEQDLPELSFPVPAQDLIPDMVGENELGATTPVAQTDADADAASLLIPIQGSIVAHSRSGRPSVAAVTERRVKNTEAARRSRARRADKLAELRVRNEELSKRNVALVAENERLRALVRALEDKLHLTEN